MRFNRGLNSGRAGSSLTGSEDEISSGALTGLLPHRRITFWKSQNPSIAGRGSANTDASTRHFLIPH